MKKTVPFLLLLLSLKSHTDEIVRYNAEKEASKAIEKWDYDSFARNLKEIMKNDNEFCKLGTKNDQRKEDILTKLQTLKNQAEDKNERTQKYTTNTYRAKKLTQTVQGGALTGVGFVLSLVSVLGCLFGTGKRNKTNQDEEGDPFLFLPLAAGGSLWFGISYMWNGIGRFRNADAIVEARKKNVQQIKDLANNSYTIDENGKLNLTPPQDSE